MSCNCSEPRLTLSPKKEMCPSCGKVHRVMQLPTDEEIRAAEMKRMKIEAERERVKAEALKAEADAKAEYEARLNHDEAQRWQKARHKRDRAGNLIYQPNPSNVPYDIKHPRWSDAHPFDPTKAPILPAMYKVNYQFTMNPPTPEKPEKFKNAYLGEFMA